MKRIFALKLHITITALALVLTGCRTTEVIEVVDFDTCEAAGNPVMESYPRQCRTPEGRLYTEDIDAGNVACTMDAKVCPDGSAVGRIPPNCDFDVCPGE